MGCEFATVTFTVPVDCIKCAAAMDIIITRDVKLDTHIQSFYTQ